MCGGCHGDPGRDLPCAAQNAPPPPDVPEHDAAIPRSESVRAGSGSDAVGNADRPRGSCATDSGAPTLSDKLAQTDGVICPPNIDPDIKAPTPQGGPMPVIPPPGSPGGDPSVRPK